MKAPDSSVFKARKKFLQAKFSTQHEMNYNKISKTEISLGNRSIWGRFNINLNQDINFPFFNQPAIYSTTLDSRFIMFDLFWNFIFQIDNLCPLCTGEKEKGIINTLALGNTFNMKLLGIRKI